MTPTKILIGQIILVFAVVIASVWAATQWAAAALGHDPALGSPWFKIGEQNVYIPWRLFEWWYAYEAYAPGVFNRAGAMAAAGGFLGAGFAIIGSVLRARQSKNVTTYGSSRWAVAKEIARAKLFEPAGVFLGRFKNRYLRHDGPEHVMAFAPTRSGKGVGLVIPTLLSWPHSTVVHDIKGENWSLTAGWRSKFSHCLLFNPTDGDSARYNPLLEVRRDIHEVRDVQNIADILVDPEGALERRSHWEKTAHALLTGVILHVLYAEKEKTLARVAEFLSDPSRSFSRTLWIMMTTNHIGDEEGPKAHPVVAGAARELLNKSENERSGVLSTAVSFLSLYRDPTVAKVTSACDWRIADLTDAKRPVSLYLVIPPSDISRTKPLVRLVLNQIGRRLTEKLEGDVAVSKRRKVLLMLDEFPALGRLDFFESALAFMAGYGVRAFLIAQSLNQIAKAYGENNAILDNCHVRVAFASNDDRTSKRISDMLGAKTELRAMRNYAGHRLAPWLAHVMVSRQETQRPLLTPGEVMQLPPNDELILVSGLPPIKAKKLRYYEDGNFKERVLAPPELGASEYPDKPEARADDWGAVSRNVDDRLVKPWFSLVSEGGDDGGGLRQQPELDAPDAEKPAKDQTPDRPAVDDDDPDIAARRMAQMGQRLNQVQRAHGLNVGVEDDILKGF